MVAKPVRIGLHPDDPPAGNDQDRQEAEQEHPWRMSAAAAQLREAEDEPGRCDQPDCGPVAAGGRAVDMRAREPEQCSCPGRAEQCEWNSVHSAESHVSILPFSLQRETAPCGY